MTSRAANVELAKLCEQMERYDDMAKYMKEVAQGGEKLSDEERNLLSVAFKNIIGARRSQWRIISSIEQKCADKAGDTGLQMALREEVEEELRERCGEVLDLIDKYLLNGSLEEIETEPKVFLLKMKGDYFRYLVEVANSCERDGLKEMALNAYNDGYKFASEMPPTHPIMLGLILNFSVFYYEIVNDSTKACELAKKGFDDAIAVLDNLPEDSYKDSTLIMQLLRDNLTLWISKSENE